VAWNLFRREPNFDELQAWTIARASRTPLDLVYNTAYEGRMPVWHLVLWCAQRISTDLVVLRLVTLGLAIPLGVLVATLPRLGVGTRALLLAGFPGLVGLPTFSRDYVLVVILALGATHLAIRRRHGSLTVVLTVLAMVNLFGLMTAGALTTARLLDMLRGRRSGHTTRGQIIVLAGMPLAAAAVSAWRIAPPSDSSMWRPTWSSFRPRDAALAAIDGWGAVVAPLGSATWTRVVGSLVLIAVGVAATRMGVAMVGGIALLVLLTMTNAVWGYFAGWWQAQQLWIGLVALLTVGVGVAQMRGRGLAARLIMILAMLQLVPHFTERGRQAWTGLSSQHAVMQPSEVVRIAERACAPPCVLFTTYDLPEATLVAAHLGRPVLALNRGEAVWFASYSSQVRTTGDAIAWRDITKEMSRHEHAFAILGRSRWDDPNDPLPDEVRRHPDVGVDAELWLVGLEDD
jgi:hypothetical protein